MIGVGGGPSPHSNVTGKQPQQHHHHQSSQSSSSGSSSKSRGGNSNSNSSSSGGGGGARWLLCYPAGKGRGGGRGGTGSSSESPSPPGSDTEGGPGGPDGSRGSKGNHGRSNASTPSPTDHGFKIPNSNERPTSLPVALQLNPTGNRALHGNSNGNQTEKKRFAHLHGKTQQYVATENAFTTFIHILSPSFSKIRVAANLLN